MLATSSALETKLATRLDRWMDRAVSSQSCDAACEASFGATAGSAPPNRALGVLLFVSSGIVVRQPAPLPGHPLPTTGLGGREVAFSVRRDDGAVSSVQGGGAEPAVDGEGSGLVRVRYRQELWIEADQAATFPGWSCVPFLRDFTFVTLSSRTSLRSTRMPSLNVTPALTSGSSSRPSRRRQLA